MTVSPGAGFPDWQDYPQWGKNVLSQQSFNALPNTASVFFTGALPNYSAVLLEVTVNSGSGSVGVVRYPPGGAVPIPKNWSWNMTAGGPSLVVILPTMGEAIQFSITEGTGSASFNVNVNMTALNFQVSRSSYLASRNTAVADAVTVPASSRVNLPLPAIASGRASINVNQAGTGTLSQIQVETLNADGTWSILALFDLSDTGRHFYDIALPGQAVRLALVNFTTVAVTNVYAAIWTDTD